VTCNKVGLASDSQQRRNRFGGLRWHDRHVPADAPHEHAHHHLVCERCGAVEHFHDDALGDLPDRLLDATGYTLGTREISLFGLCPACRADRG